MRVLIVDDQIDVVRGLMSAIRWDRLGVDEVHTAYSVTQAEQLLQDHAIDILLCDIEMPPRSGLELLSYIEKNKLATYSIVLSSHAEFSYAQEALRHGAFDYIIQPASYLEIEKAILRAREDLHAGQATPPDEVLDASMITDETPVIDDPIQVILAHIRQNISSPLSREEIAEAVYLNPDYVARIFKRSMGMTIGEYITREKIEFAKSMLIDTETPVSVIALRVGYSNFSYFSQLFRKATGYSPNEFRRMYRDT